MKRLALLLLVSLICSALPGRAQVCRGEDALGNEVWVNCYAARSPGFIRLVDMGTASPTASSIPPPLPPQANSSQPTIAFRFGATLQPSTEAARPAGQLSFVIGGGTMRSLTKFNLSRADAQTVTEVEQGFERTVFKRGRLELFGCGTLGVATNADATSGSVEGCLGGEVYFGKGLSLIVTGAAENAPLRGGTWKPGSSISLQWKPE